MRLRRCSARPGKKLSRRRALEPCAARKTLRFQMEFGTCRGQREKRPSPEPRMRNGTGSPKSSAASRFNDRPAGAGGAYPRTVWPDGAPPLPARADNAVSASVDSDDQNALHRSSLNVSSRHIICVALFLASSRAKRSGVEGSRREDARPRTPQLCVVVARFLHCAAPPLRSK